MEYNNSNVKKSHVVINQFEDFKKGNSDIKITRKEFCKNTVA